MFRYIISSTLKINIKHTHIAEPSCRYTYTLLSCANHPSFISVSGGRYHQATHSHPKAKLHSHCPPPSPIPKTTREMSHQSVVSLHHLHKPHCPLAMHITILQGWAPPVPVFLLPPGGFLCVCINKVVGRHKMHPIPLEICLQEARSCC